MWSRPRSDDPAARFEACGSLALLYGAVTDDLSVPADVEYRVPFRTAALSMAFFAVMAAVFAYMAVAGHGPFVGVAALCAVYMGYAVVRNIIRVVLRQPYAVFRKDGLTLTAGRAVSWDEIASVAVFTGTSAVGWKGSIAIALHDPDAYIARIGVFQRRTARAGVARGLGPIRMPAEAFPVPVEDVIATMRRFHPGLVVNA